TGENAASRGTLGCRGSPQPSAIPGPAFRLGTGSARRAADLAADVAEGVVGVGAQGGDGGDAHHDDQGQHDGVLDRGRAILSLQKVDDAVSELTHYSSPCANTEKRTGLVN